MKLGKRQKLRITRIKEFGVYLEEENGNESVLLPKKQVPKNAEIGTELEVFLYRDSSDRMIATTKPTLLEVGEVAKVLVKDIGKIGAFVDIGLERDVLLPYREMRRQVHKGEEILCALYIDRSNRLAVTMRIYPYLKTTSNYQKDDEVTGTIYDIKDIGILVAVENQYYGLVPKSECYERLEIGDTIQARVLRVREDGKLDLRIRQKAYLQIEIDAKKLEEELEKRGGALGVSEKAEPKVIQKEFGLSKSAFKRALGHLLKLGKIEITLDNILQK